MTISMYRASVPVFSAALKNLDHVLRKGEAAAAGLGLEAVDLLQARLAPDMLTLVNQVQIATDNAKGAASRLAGRDIPRYEDNEASFADLHARIDKTRAYLGTFAAGDIDGSEERPVTLRFGPREMKFTGEQYLLHFALPNFFFHVVTAYDILRHRGVGIGKVDYFGSGG